MNGTNITQDYYYCKYDKPDSDVVRTVKIMTILLLGGLGVFGNILAIVIAAKYTVRRNLHPLIINMAVSDMLVSIMGLFFYFQRVHYSQMWKDVEGIWGDILCKTFPFLYDTSISVSLVTLLIISIERFKITRQTVQIVRPYTMKQRVAILTSSWLVVMFFQAHNLILLKVMKNSETGSYYCGISNVEILMAMFTVIIILVILLYCLIFSLSIVTLRRLSKPQAIQANLSEEQREQRRKRMVNALRMVLCSLLLYSCCYLPLFIYVLLRTLPYYLPNAKIIDYSTCMDWSTFGFMTHSLLPHINSCLSPCVYFVFLTDFRGAAKRLLCRKNN